MWVKDFQKGPSVEGLTLQSLEKQANFTLIFPMKGESIGSKNYIKEKLMLRSRRQKGAAFSFKWIHTAGLRDQAAQSLYHKLWYPGFSQQGRVLIWALFWKERRVFMEHCRYLRRAGKKTGRLISCSGLCWPPLIDSVSDSGNEVCTAYMAPEAFWLVNSYPIISPCSAKPSFPLWSGSLQVCMGNSPPGAEIQAVPSCLARGVFSFKFNSQRQLSSL